MDREVPMFHLLLALFLVSLFFLLEALRQKFPLTNKQWDDFWDSMLLLGASASLVYLAGAMIVLARTLGWW